MKKALIVCFLFIGVSCKLFAQKLPDYSTIKLEQNADYVKADTVVLQTCNFLLSTPIDKNSAERKEAGTFLINSSC